MFTITATTRPSDFPAGVPIGPQQQAPSGETEQWEIFNGDLIVRNTQQATITPFMPKDGAAARGQAVLIVPGGAMMLVSVQNEGIKVAEYLSSLGYACFVLTYRVNPTPRSTEGFLQRCQEFIGESAAFEPGNFEKRLELAHGATDVIDAMQYIRDHAQDYRVDANKIHYLGFSAGAVLGLNLLEQSSETTMPATMACLYGDMRQIELGNSMPPPLFAALSNDDPFFARQGFGLIEQWQKRRQQLEFHLFERGGHGYGMNVRDGTSDHWAFLYSEWLSRQV